MFNAYGNMLAFLNTIPTEPVPASVIITDLIEQSERTICRLAFWLGLLPDWLEPIVIAKMLRRLEAITGQLEHFAGLNR